MQFSDNEKTVTALHGWLIAPRKRGFTLICTVFFFKWFGSEVEKCDEIILAKLWRDINKCGHYRGAITTFKCEA